MAIPIEPAEPMASTVPRQQRSRERRGAIIRATADLIAGQGVASVSHRSVAAEAKVPLAATTYYFSDLDELLEAAGRVLTNEWIANARHVAEHLTGAGDSRADSTRGKAEILVTALLPPGDEGVVRSHYERLVEAGRRPAVARAFAVARPELDDALGDVLAGLGLAGSAPERKSKIDSKLILALVDGAAVSALSEGHDVREAAVQLLDGYFVSCLDS